MSLSSRAAAHAALGDPRRLEIADHVAAGDRTVGELAEISGMRGNLLAHHLDVLESAGLIERRVSEGDHRKRYVRLRWDRLPLLPRQERTSLENVAFVCTHNSARSQFAAALWTERTGNQASSAGSQPAPEVHPSAISVASEYRIDLSRAKPSGYDSLPPKPDLVVSVCDRALEAGIPAARGHIHWSVPDPVSDGTLRAFREAFAEISQRMDQLAPRAEAGA